jgi:hypothetical protein
MNIENKTKIWTRRQFVSTVSFMPLAIYSYVNRVNANPIGGFVLIELKNFASAVMASVAASTIYDYLKSRSLPASSVEAIRHHQDEMREEGFIHPEEVYTVDGTELLFFGIQHEKGQNGCMVVRSPEGVSCLKGPTIVGLARAAYVLHQSGSIKPKSHIALALLPRGTMS